MQMNLTDFVFMRERNYIPNTLLYSLSKKLNSKLSISFVNLEIISNRQQFFFHICKQFNIQLPFVLSVTERKVWTSVVSNSPEYLLGVVFRLWFGYKNKTARSNKEPPKILKGRHAFRQQYYLTRLWAHTAWCSTNERSCIILKFFIVLSSRTEETKGFCFWIGV